MMKKALIILLLAFPSLLQAQNQFQFDFLSFKNILNTSLSIKNFNGFDFLQKESIMYLVADSKIEFNEWEYSKKLFTSLENYNLVLDNSEFSNQGRASFNIDYIGKNFFDDYYKSYKNDLSRFLPQVPDANLLCPIY